MQADRTVTDECDESKDTDAEQLIGEMEKAVREYLEYVERTDAAPAVQS